MPLFFLAPTKRSKKKALAIDEVMGGQGYKIGFLKSGLEFPAAQFYMFLKV